MISGRSLRVNTEGNWRHSVAKNTELLEVACLHESYSRRVSKVILTFNETLDKQVCNLSYDYCPHVKAHETLVWDLTLAEI